MEVWPSWLALVVGLVVILLGCDIFTNSIEWLGKKLDLNEGVLGSVFAAVGTALPETLIPIVAIAFGSQSENSHAEDVGIGAIIGAPFMLATVAMFVTGTAVFIFSRRGRRTPVMRVNSRVISRDLRFFLLPFAVAVMCGFVANLAVKVVVACCMLAYYAFYVFKHATDESDPATDEDAEDLSPLHFARRSEDPPLVIVVVQAVVGVGLIVGAAYLFVQNVSQVASSVGITPLVLSLIVVPLATELPEKFNSVLWVRRTKDTLAMGNVTGAMVFQSTIPVSFGLVFTQWRITPESMPAFLQAALAIVAAIILLSAIGRKGILTPRSLLYSGLWYVIWLIMVFPLSTRLTEFAEKLGWGV